MSGRDAILQTDRLTLRRWRGTDRAAFHDLNRDPAVMATIGPVMTRAESDAFMNRIEAHFDEYGYGLWCVDLDRESIGFVGLSHPWWRDGVEVGWRLRSAWWGHGYATEAARAALAFGFERAGLDSIISFTAATNERSQAVMRRIGLERVADADFDHPSVPDGSPLRPHVLYRLDADTWRDRAA